MTMTAWTSANVKHLAAFHATYPEAAPADDPVIGNICPECEGAATEIVYHSAARDWDTGEYVDAEEIACPACDGLGYLTMPLTEQDVKEHRA
jgi:hypothetical protein